jgi:hypothetical protein
VDATQKRRLVVLAVCALGVSALYLAPGMAGSPEQLTTRQPETTPRPSAAPTGQASASPSSVGRPVSARVSTAAAERADPRGPAGVETTTAARTTAYDTRPGARTAQRDHDARRDRTRPARVSSVEVGDVTPDSVTVRWAATSDAGVVSYRVSLNGFEVASTTEHQATIEFFRDDSTENVVQIRAVDRAGNASAASTSVLVDRPSTTPAPTADPDDAGPGPTDGPTTFSPTASSSRSATVASTSPTRTSPTQGSGTDQQEPSPTDPTTTASSFTARDPHGQNAGRSSDPDASGEHE